MAVGPVTFWKVETTSIGIQWPCPKYSPVSIRVVFQCSLWCENQPYNEKRVYVSLQHNKTLFNSLKPGSRCKLNFAIFYNPSEFDRGVDYAFETLSASKFSHECTHKTLGFLLQHNKQ